MPFSGTFTMTTEQTMTTGANDRLLEIENLKVRFSVPGTKRELRAVDGVTLHVDRGESVGLVGESGCGKSTTGNAVIGLAPVTEGRITFRGRDVGAMGRAEMKKFREQVQMIFQDPFGSLNPRMTVGGAIGEVLKVHRIERTTAGRNARILELMSLVGLEPAYAGRYPHEFSGGQRQRIGVARALAVGPSLLIADEPVSALDVSVQAQIMNLLKDLQRERNLAFLFIAHDLAVVRYMCDRVMVMYLGRIVESAPVLELFSRPSHPYTEALLSAVPDIDRALKAGGSGSRRIVLKGDVPSPVDIIPGCPFHPRCHRAGPICSKEAPPVIDLGGGHTSVCHFARTASS